MERDQGSDAFSEVSDEEIVSLDDAANDPASEGKVSDTLRPADSAVYVEEVSDGTPTPAEGIDWEDATEHGVLLAEVVDEAVLAEEITGGGNAVMVRAEDFAVVEEALVVDDDVELHCDEVSLLEIASVVGTPTHVYSAFAIEEAFRSADEALGDTPHLVCYATKANGHPAILRRLAKLGAGADVVSGGELYWALQSGFPPDRIVFSGVGKSDAEITMALEARIRAIHVESESELLAIEEIAQSLGLIARIGLRINPDVDPGTHPYISTGLKKNKFGLEMDRARALLPRLIESPVLELQTITCHIGSQIGNAKAVEDAVALAASFVLECIDAGALVQAIDAGGGWPVRYGDEKSPHAPRAHFGEAIREGIRRAGAAELELEVVVELGRTLVAEAGALLTRVLHVKEQGGKRFVIVDASMTELMRPALYQAYHEIVPVLPREGPLSPADIVGPVCETSDFLGLDRMLPRLERGDYLLVRTTGAYGAVMSSEYNARPRAAEVLVVGDTFDVIRERGRIEHLYRGL